MKRFATFLLRLAATSFGVSAQAAFDTTHKAWDALVKKHRRGAARRPGELVVN